MKRDLLSSIYLELFPTEFDCELVNKFIKFPISLERKYDMIRLSDILTKNKKADISLEYLVEGLGQLAKIGQELLKNEDVRNSKWKSLPVVKEISVERKTSQRAPWEKIKVWRESER